VQSSSTYVGSYRPRVLALVRGSASRPSRNLRLTVEGWGWLIIALVLWTIAFSKGINLLLLLSYLMLLALVMNAVLAGRQLRGVSVRRRPGAPLFANEPADVELAVECDRPGGIYSLRVEDRGETHVQQWFFDRLEHRATCRGAEAVCVPHRGWYAWGPACVLSGYPLGLVERSVEGEPGRPVLVFPALGTLQRARFRRFLYRTAPAPGESRRPARRHPAAQGEFHGLREFRAGDSPRWVHWRTSARRNVLMVREFEEPPPDDLTVILEPWLPSAGRFEESERARDQLEAAISFAATVCCEWCRRSNGNRVLLAVAGSVEPIVIEGPASTSLEPLLLECLALVSGGAIDTDRLMRGLAARPLPRGPILLISTRPPVIADELSGRLGRAVIGLDVAELPEHDFYESPKAAATMNEDD
jgi:uncharacterized protein (DUF58 family)